MARSQVSTRRSIINSNYSTSYDATTSFIDLGAAGPIASALTSFTVSAWVKPTTNKLEGIVADIDPGTLHFALEFNNATSARLQPQLRVQTDGTPGTALGAGTRAIAGQWCMVTGVYDGTNAIVYLNGQAVGSTPVSGTCQPSGKNMHIGNGQNNARFFTGLIDTVQFAKNVAFTPTQVNQLYIDNFTPQLRALMTNEWLMEEGSGTSIADNIGTNTGTATNVTWTTDTAFKSRNQASQRRRAGNLVANSDFEIVPTFVAAQTTSGKWIDGTSTGSSSNSTSKWAFLTKAGTGQVQFDTTNKHAGTASLKISTTAVASNMEVANVTTTAASQVYLQGLSVLPSTTYTLNFWLKTNVTSGDSSDGAFILVSFRDSTGAGISSNSSSKVKVTQDWTFFSSTFTTTSATKIIYVRPSVNGSTGTGTLIMDAWFDDIEIIQGTNGGRIQIS